MSLRTPELEAEIVARLSKGEPLAVICRDEHMPCDDTVRNWQDADPAFARAIARAREAGFDAIANRTRATARKLSPEEGGDSTGDVQRDKLIIETDLKLLAKWDPKRYGERTTVVGDKTADPVQVQASVDVSGLSDAALAEIAALRVTK